MAFQFGAFQSGFQCAPIAVSGVEIIHGGGGATTWQKYRDEEYQRQKLKKERSDLEKLESVLAENKRRAKLAKESLEAAKTKAAKLRLERLEAEYLDEIARLLAVREVLRQRVKQAEEMLILAIALKRRMRVVNWQGINLARTYGE